MIELLNTAVLGIASDAVTAGTTAVTSNVFDMTGFSAVTFLAVLGTVVDTSALSLTCYENSANSTSGGTAVTNGATATFTASTSSNTMLAVDVIRPSKRYVYCVLARATANATVNSIVALQYRATSLPVTQPASVIASATSTPEV